MANRATTPGSGRSLGTLATAVQGVAGMNGDGRRLGGGRPQYLVGSWRPSIIAAVIGCGAIG